LTVVTSTEETYYIRVRPYSSNSGAYQIGFNTSIVPPGAPYQIGDTGPGGGKIFYYSGTGFIMTDTNERCYYLEVAPTYKSCAWTTASFASTRINNLGTTIGTGRRNTALIIATNPGYISFPAADFCKNYTGGDKTDWFLPSKDELNQLYVNRAAVSFMGTVTYLSSSQFGDTSVWGQDFSAATEIYSQSGYGTLTPSYYVRPVRAF